MKRRQEGPDRRQPAGPDVIWVPPPAPFFFCLIWPPAFFLKHIVGQEVPQVQVRSSLEAWVTEQLHWMELYCIHVYRAHPPSSDPDTGSVPGCHRVYCGVGGGRRGHLTSRNNGAHIREEQKRLRMRSHLQSAVVRTHSGFVCEKILSMKEGEEEFRKKKNINMVSVETLFNSVH